MDVKLSPFQRDYIRAKLYQQFNKNNQEFYQKDRQEYHFQERLWVENQYQKCCYTA